ncbi:MAG TPA: winged helix-turn-helix domain-containing protein [Alcaligenes sp.]|nr:winged helix-turn-helix domain-containing protein [Alcaligenes sp.]HRL26325.1 winged helix-turn-helix domain-containing protein [Alcaligenes sp.]
MTVERVFLLYDDAAMLHKIVAESGQWGVHMQTLGSMDECLSVARSEPAELVCALRFQADSVFLYVNRLRADFPAAGIIILRGENVAGLERGHLLLVGADACFDASALPVEVVASIQALRRRGRALRQSLQAAVTSMPEAHAAATVQQDWDLHENGWRLQTPRGHSIMLTRGERRIMLVLFSACPETVERDRLFATDPGRELPARSVDVLISRLKRKLASVGEELPIRSVRGEGYAFVGKVQSGGMEQARLCLQDEV